MYTSVCDRCPGVSESGQKAPAPAPAHLSASGRQEQRTAYGRQLIHSEIQELSKLNDVDHLTNEKSRREIRDLVRKEVGRHPRAGEEGFAVGPKCAEFKSRTLPFSVLKHAAVLFYGNYNACVVHKFWFHL